MKYVYSTSIAAEAHMLVHLLEREGIKAGIHGEDLVGLVGAGTSIDPIKIYVEDGDYDKARSFILAWERKNPEQAQVSSVNDKSASYPLLLLYLLAGLSVGWFANNYFHEQNATRRDLTEKIDNNNDGKADVIYRYKNTNSDYPESAEMDRNYDEKFDYVLQYGPDGSMKSDKSDDDFDGRFESKGGYKNGLVQKIETDTDGDQKIDLISHYNHGILSKIDFIDPKTSLPVKTSYYKNHLLESSDFDSDKDGFLETRILYDAYEQVTKTEKK